MKFRMRAHIAGLAISFPLAALPTSAVVKAQRPKTSKPAIDKARDTMIAAKHDRVTCTKQFDLSALPDYVPETTVTGVSLTRMGADQQGGQGPGQAHRPL